MSLVRTNCSPPIESSAAESLARTAQVAASMAPPTRTKYPNFSRSMAVPLHRDETYVRVDVESTGRHGSRRCEFHRSAQSGSASRFCAVFRFKQLISLVYIGTSRTIGRRNPVQIRAEMIERDCPVARPTGRATEVGRTMPVSSSVDWSNIAANMFRQKWLFQAPVLGWTASFAGITAA